MVLAVFGQTLGFEFINYDDGDYIYENPEIIPGLSVRAIFRAFNLRHGGNWHPLTTLSHMLDCQMYALNPWGHHLGNVLLHGLAAILLFLVLKQMTGTLWRSAVVAAVFAVHPLRAESVAWVSERKDVLSGVFFMLTLLAYARYVRLPRATPPSPIPHHRSPITSLPYGAVLVFFALAVMSKPTVVALPFGLLLLDWWPLGRLEGRLTWSRVRRLLLEKIPLLLLSAGGCFMTLRAQKGALDVAVHPSFAYGLANAAVSYAVYVRQMFWPVSLALFYPHPVNALPLWEAGLALLVLLVISAAVGVWWKKHPWLAVGWLWYLGMLVPVIGILQVGAQARADRYTYLPQIGLYVAVVWAAARLGGRLGWRPWMYGVLSAGVLLPLTIVAHVQTSYWRDSESLWKHTLACTENNQIAHRNLGLAVFKKGRVDEAIAHYEEALRIMPVFADVHYNLGFALQQKGDVEGAMAHYEKAIEFQPDFPQALTNLAYFLATSDRAASRDGARAVELAEKANRLTYGSSPVILGTLAAAYAEQGRFPEAVDTVGRAVEQAAAQGNSVLAQGLQEQLKTYQAGLPLRDTQ